MAKRTKQRQTTGELDEAAERFVQEYVVDFRAEAAALRCGIPRLSAGSTARRWLGLPAVAKAIQSAIDGMAQDKMATANRVIAGFLREAHDENNHPDTRLAALRSLAGIVEISPSAKSASGKGKKGDDVPGVVIVPGTSSAPSSWEAEAIKMQAALKERVRE